MSPYELDARAWQESWDRQQEAYLPDREHRIGVMLDAVAAVVDHDTPRLLDLAGGTGSISLRALARFPRAEITLVDLDPVLLAIAETSLGDRATVVTADLNTPDWTAALPHREYDAVLTATALHWIAEPRLAALYTELRGLLRPGGLFANADHMPDAGLPTLTDRLVARADAHRSARYAAGAVLSWSAWWQHVAADPVLAPLAEKRGQIYPTGHSDDWLPPATWHLDALRAAGFTETGLLWRGGADAVVAGVR
ncbi:class I SAM-dependent methyltransferase [Micromonospora sp. WMMD882]|uniref:class I SAM-dependent methyltransferase n=1 Tax=Micromonospora sp. WMMD882 TaxID=3015151 RepID=UPI00248D2C45|nr:class I SAM-dependent methyltransferase [Micromonospora sp. WMMD882]WBB77794.1 class I SAM-dependent methyltransferase [Micromonospora sp. WMMD882]